MSLCKWIGQFQEGSTTRPGLGTWMQRWTLPSWPPVVQREELHACVAVWNPGIVMPFKRRASCLEIHLTKLSKTGPNKNNPCWRTRLSFLWWPAARFMRSLPVKRNMKQGPCQRGFKESHATSEADLLSCIWDEVLPLVQDWRSGYKPLNPVGYCSGALWRILPGSTKTYYVPPYWCSHARKCNENISQFAASYLCRKFLFLFFRNSRVCCISYRPV